MKKLLSVLSLLLLATAALAVWPLASSSVHALQEVSKPAVKTFDRLARQPETPSISRASTLEDAARRFIGMLSKQPGFESWAGAGWTSSPLGPGTHGWIVIIQQKDGTDAGYLVIHAAMDGSFRLSEYGKGSYPLYSLQTLHRSLVQLELIEYPYQAERLYFGPLQGIWKVSVPGANRIWYIDAKTGEELPITSDDQLPLLQSEASPLTESADSHIITQSGNTLPADVFERLPWVENRGDSSLTADKLIGWVSQQRSPLYAAELYRDNVLLPLSVSGFHQWSSGELYVEFRQDDDRYVPLEPINRLGGFFP